jgi:hypothetical protein
MKTFSIIFVFTLIFFQTNAQNHFGVKGGISLNKTQIKGKAPLNGLETEFNIGYHFGVFYRAGLTERLSLIPELQFSMKGAKYVDEYYGDVKVKVGYLELPVLLSCKVIDKLSIEAGPYVALNVSDEFGIFEDLDAGAIAGLRFNISEKLGVVGRYCYGITAASKISFRDSNNVPMGEVKEYHRNIQVGVTYSFLKK